MSVFLLHPANCTQCGLCIKALPFFHYSSDGLTVDEEKMNILMQGPYRQEVEKRLEFLETNCGAGVFKYLPRTLQVVNTVIGKETREEFEKKVNEVFSK